MGAAVSLVTDLVFILPCLGPDGPASRERFEVSFREAHGWELAPQEGAGRCMATDVYVAGVNYMDPRWLKAVLADQWPQGTVLWLYPEEAGGDPGQPIVYQLGPKEQQ